MLTVYPDTFVLVQIHTGGTAYILWGGQRAVFYGLEGTPTAWINGIYERIGGGTVSGLFSAYRTYYNNAMAQSTDVTIDLAAEPVGGTSYLVQANVCIEAGGVGKTMRVHMVQVQDNYPNPPTYSRYGLRQSAFTHSGAPVISLSAGECQQIRGGA